MTHGFNYVPSPQHGAYVNQGDGNRDTALHWAAYKNNTACLKLLLQSGANVNAVDYNNDTPISWAARKGISPSKDQYIEQYFLLSIVIPH